MRSGRASSKGSFHRLIPASLAITERPLLSIVLMAFVHSFSRTQRLPSGQYTFLSCRLGCCSFRLRLWEKVTLYPLLAFLPVRSQTRDAAERGRAWGWVSSQGERPSVDSAPMHSPAGRVRGGYL